MKFNRVFFFVLVAALAMFLTACGAAPATNWPGLASDGTHVYLADGQFLYNILLSDGSEVTMQTAEGPVPARFPLKAESTKSFSAAPALTADGQLVIGSAAQSENTLYSINSVSGKENWRFPGPPKSPWLAGALILNDTVYAPGGDGQLFAINLRDGTQRWALKASDHSLWTGPITDGKLIFLATLNHDVYALNPDNNKPIWKIKLDNGIIGAPSYVDGMLYVGTLSGNLYALNAADGKQKWVKTLDGGIWGTPATDGEKVYVGTVKPTGGKFYALKASTGEIIWSKDEEGSIVAGPLVTTDQVVYTTETGRIQALDKSGAPKWQDTIENAKLYTPPFLAGEVILIAPMNAKFLLAAYDLNGAQKWTFIAK